MDPALKVLYSRKEASRALAISESTLDEMIMQGKLKAARMGRRVFIHRDEVERIGRLVASGRAERIWPEWHAAPEEIANIVDRAKRKKAVA